MPALTFGRFAVTVLLASLPFFLQAAESDGEWNCSQASDTGKWSCARDGVSATDLSATENPAAENPASETASTAELDPYEARARAAVVRIDRPTTESPTEPSAAEPTALVDEPIAPAVIAATEPDPVSLPTPAPEPEPVAEPAADTPVDRSSLPDFQRLAYVPDQPTSLLELPPGFWVAQLMAVSSKEFLESYAEEHNLRGLSAARIASGERLFFVLILGIYETKANAERAISNLPPPYTKYKPLLRTLGSLQDAMRKADQITGSSDF